MDVMCSCDPQARAILVDAVLRLARLGAERGVREPSWLGVRDRALQTLISWLVRQSDLVRDLSCSSFSCPQGSKVRREPECRWPSGWLVQRQLTAGSMT